jgi:archaemetzincin
MALACSYNSAMPQRRHRRTFVSLATMLSFPIAAFCLGLAVDRLPAEPPVAAEKPRALVTTPTEAEVRTAADAIRPLHSKMDKPGPNDWLANHKEAGQSFAQYQQRHKQRICNKYQTMYIQPLGDFTQTQKKLLAETTDFMGRFYGLPVKTLGTVSLDQVPEKARRARAEVTAPQILTHYLLDDVLKARRPKDAVAVLGLTASDLWPGEGWNFVFGQASLTERVGVWSIQRFGDPEAGNEEYKLSLLRTLKVAVHETGHMLGIDHCIAYKCCMNGSNHLTESDSQPLEFCPECQSKLWWTCGVAPLPRYRNLLEFAESRGLEAESEYWRQAIGIFSLLKSVR